MDVKEVIQLFSNKDAVYITIKNTSHGDDDFRETLLVDFGTEKIVIKLAANVLQMKNIFYSGNRLLLNTANLATTALFLSGLLMEHIQQFHIKAKIV